LTCFFFSNMGPNTTTYVLSAEAFPRDARSTSHGISAACGKAGALIGVAGFPPMVAAVGVGPVFHLCGCILVLGFILTLIFIPETKGMVLPEFESDSGTIDTKSKSDESELQSKKEDVVVV